MSITLKDVALADKVYQPFRTNGDRSEYIGPNHSDVTKDWASLMSTAPKKTAATFGNRRSTFKVVRTVTVSTPDGGTEQKDARIEISVSLPVGTSTSDLDELQNRGFSIPDAVFDSLVASGQTQF